MLWVLGLHICALLFWCGTLLYLPVVICNAPGAETHRSFNKVERFLFTQVATPAALLAIMSGTIVFVINGTVDSWLIAKLTVVTGLVVCHCLVGSQILQAEAALPLGSGIDKPFGRRCRVLAVVIGILITTIIGLVLAKMPVVVPW